ncbi:hypothetical protein GCM10009760_50640 [Kitasatospora kazusensis]|uniref:Protein-glutamine gamma-glutamyltransferase-like C-terminal domain-containing protein n=1 Tax=Kitasatospora kazusensis TaxID=407974 RepID=A0ABN3A3F8_9ACTN
MGRRTDRIPGRSTAVRPVLALLAAAALALAALALRPAPGGSPWLARGPLAHDSGAIWLLALGGVLGCGALAARHRRDVLENSAPTPAAERLAEVASFALPAAALLAPLILFLLPAPARVAPPSTPSEGPPPPPPPPPFPPGASSDPIPLDAQLLLAVFGSALVIAAVVLLVVSLHRYGLRLPRRRRPAAAGTRPVTGRALAEAVDSARRALHGEDVRAAVIACYAAMESSLAESGVARQASDSPADLLRRADADGVLAGPHPQVLAALFREARYSSHPMGAEQLGRARAALDAIASQLAGRTGLSERAAR